MMREDALLEIAQIRKTLDEAAEDLLGAAERAMGLLSGSGAEGLETEISAMISACAFHDLVGQRLTRLEALIGEQAPDMRNAPELLNGPANPGQGLDQAAADRLMSD